MTMKQVIMQWGKGLMEDTGNNAVFFQSFIRNLMHNGIDRGELLRQCYLLGLKSLNIVLITGFILGFVLTLQSQPTL